MREWLKTTIHSFWVSLGVILSFICFFSYKSKKNNDLNHSVVTRVGNCRLHRWQSGALHRHLVNDVKSDTN